VIIEFGKRRLVIGDWLIQSFAKQNLLKTNHQLPN